MDAVWDAVVELCAELGPVVGRRSRYADKPALWLDRREVAHCEAPGWVDLRITAAAWRAQRAAYADDPCVDATRRRRDWIGLHLTCRADVERLRPLFAAALAADTS